MNENRLSVFLIITMLLLTVTIIFLSRTASDLRAENDRLRTMVCEYTNCSYMEINE